MAEPLRVLTVHPEWAHAIIHLGKEVENRTWWYPSIAGDLAIHASTRKSAWDVQKFLTGLGCELPDGLPTGAIVGVVTVTGAHNSAACTRWGWRGADRQMCSPWAFGAATGHGPQMHWELTGPRPCPPVPCKGQLGIWTAPPDVAAEVYRTLQPHGGRP